MKKIIYLIILTIFILPSCSLVKSNEKADIQVNKQVNKIENNITVPKVTSDIKDGNINKADSSELNTCTKNAVPAEKTIVKAPTENNSEIESIYKKLFIGEMFESGYVYLEPVSIKRDTYNEKINFVDYPGTIKFYPISSGNESFVTWHMNV